MHITLKTIAFAGIFLLASCEEATSDKTTEPVPDTANTTKLMCIPPTSYKQIEFGTGGGFSGHGTGEFLRLSSYGQLMRVVAKPLQTDSGPQWSGMYDTAIAWISVMDRFAADSVLHSQAVLSPKPVPDSAYASCSTIFDGFYWEATAKFSADSITHWNAPSMGCWDKDGTPFPTPVSEAVAALQSLEARLESTYFPRAP